MALPTASDNEFPKVILAVQSSDPTAPADGDWKLYTKAAGVYARSSNSVVGPFVASASTITTVTQSVSADLTTNNTSTWTDITGLTGISVGIGTWIVYVDIESECTTNYGPVFRVWDGTTVYAQAGLISNFIATVSTHTAFTSPPFTLSAAKTMVVQYFTDTVMDIKEFPTRGASATAVATHVTFLKLAP